MPNTIVVRADGRLGRGGGWNEKNLKVCGGGWGRN